jgi:hypothetical protein
MGLKIEQTTTAWGWARARRRLEAKTQRSSRRVAWAMLGVDGFGYMVSCSWGRRSERRGRYWEKNEMMRALS